MHIEEAISTLEILLPREQLSERDIEAIARILTEVERLQIERDEFRDRLTFIQNGHDPYGEIKRLGRVFQDQQAELAHKLSCIAHDGVRNGRMRHDIGLLLMKAVREAAEAKED